jgi:hypothetical protein
MCDICDRDCDDGEWSVVCANCLLTVHDAKGLAEEVERMRPVVEAVREASVSTDTQEALMIISDAWEVYEKGVKP